MSASFYFYDLETSGFDPKYARIMQFAGQRTDHELNPIGESTNVLIRLTPDVLPDPDAVLVTGITPQATRADGITEADFLALFAKTIATQGTTFVGYNSVRFDDEFMRYIHYRNFYDAYEWQWCNDCSRWDMLDVVRMTRALRPDGITWPVASDGRATNSLELLTSVNGLDHANAHDALSDVWATMAVARLIRAKQPKLFSYLFELRDKKKIAMLVEARQPFVYTSGAYDAAFEKTTVASMVAPVKGGALVYDLRFDPKLFAQLPAKEIAKRMRWVPRGVEREPFPVKTLRYNRCPAVAPLGVLDAASCERLQLDSEVVQAHHRQLEALPEFMNEVAQAATLLDKERGQTSMIGDELSVDGQLYEGFLSDQDRAQLASVRNAPVDELERFMPRLKDPRLQALLPLYKARNFPEQLTSEERSAWEQFCLRRLTDGGAKSRLSKYFDRMEQLVHSTNLTEKQRYLLEELRLYGESLLPAEMFA